MIEKSDEQILSEIEIHTGNAVKLLKKAYEIKLSLLDVNNLDNYIAEVKRAVEFQKFSIEEMQKAVDLQIVLSERLNSLERIPTGFG